MNIKTNFFDRPWKVNTLLLLSSFCIYGLYFHPVFLNLNSLLSSVTGDALKNYYTFSYHIKNDTGMLHFSGMNFPFGEHVVFTDCQPLLTFALRLLPFTQGYLIGILHALLFASYIITPLLFNTLFLRFGLEKFPAFFISLAVTLLAPQFSKINGGHHALAYGCIIPYSILLVLQFIDRNSFRNLVKLFVFNLALFLLHPYMGFSCSIFSFFVLAIYHVLKFNKTTVLKNLGQAGIAGLLPLITFKLFMKLSDQHPDRTTEPHGNKTLVENIDSLLAPDFGPFQKLLEYLFPHKTTHWEGHSYLGLFMILLTVAFILLAPFFLRRMQIKKEASALFLSSLLLLFISFGWQNTLMDLIHLKSSSLSQFRATCRFAWIFYYVLPLFIVPALFQLFKNISFQNVSRYLISTLAFSFFLINLWEAHYYFKKDESNFWKFRNLLNEKFLSPEEKSILERIKTSGTQAILPLPVFSIGSELYDRMGADYSMISSMMYSYHSGLPIISGSMSRTSISETETMLGFLNSYKKVNPANKYVSDAPIFMIRTKDPLMADEDRLLTEVSMFHKNDSLEFGEIRKKELFKRKLDTSLIYVNKSAKTDTGNSVFVPFENRKPFLSSHMSDYETIYVLDSNKIRSGNYIMSLHYHYTKKIYTSFDLVLIINKIHGKEGAWEHFQRVSTLSGFYEGFDVMEYKVELSGNCRYEFMLNGFGDEPYKISHFMLRPEKISVIATENKDSLFNNFPD